MQLPVRENGMGGIEGRGSSTGWGWGWGVGMNFVLFIPKLSKLCSHPEITGRGLCAYYWKSKR